MTATPFRTIVVGAGTVSDLWLPELVARPDAQVVAVVEVDPALARRAMARHGFESPVHEGVATAIAETGADLVVNLTPPAHHHAISLISLERGCHVFTEKPMAATLVEAYDLIATANAAGRTLAVMQQFRYMRGSRLLRDGIAEGRIGRLEFVAADYFTAPFFDGFRHQMDHPLLLEMAIHTFDQARFFTAADAISVYCHEFNPRGSRYRGDAAAVATFELSDGSTFSYRGSWAANGCPTSWYSSWRVVGDRGTVTWDGAGDPHAETLAGSNSVDSKSLSLPVEPTAWAASSDVLEGHPACLADLFASLLDGTPPPTDCTDNLQSLAMVLAATESAQRKERVEVDDLLRAAKAAAASTGSKRM